MYAVHALSYSLGIKKIERQTLFMGLYGTFYSTQVLYFIVIGSINQITESKSLMV